MFRRLGGLLGSCLPIGETLIGSFSDEVIVVVLALTPWPMSILPAKRLPQLFFRSASGDMEVEPVPGEYIEGEEAGDSPDGFSHWK